MNPQSYRDVKLIELCNRALLAEIELDTLFRPKVNTDRIYDWAMVASDGDENLANSYASLWSSSQAQKAHNKAASNG